MATQIPVLFEKTFCFVSLLPRLYTLSSLEMKGLFNRLEVKFVSTSVTGLLMGGTRFFKSRDAKVEAMCDDSSFTTQPSFTNSRCARAAAQAHLSRTGTCGRLGMGVGKAYPTL